MVILVVAALAVGAVALADVFFLLLDKNAIACNGHVKTALAFEHNALCAEAAQQERGFERVNGGRVRVGYVPHVNENAFAIGLIALKKFNKCRGLRLIEAGRNGYVEVVVAETVA
ncbi:MAG: hypothetical protein QM665_04030 [Desulfovibrio sp.]